MHCMGHHSLEHTGGGEGSLPLCVVHWVLLLLLQCHQYQVRASQVRRATLRTLRPFFLLLIKGRKGEQYSHNRQSSSSPLSPVTSLIDAYSPTSVLSSPATVPLGTTVVLVCRVGGVASGTQLSYTWTCPNGPCDVGEGNNPNRKTYGDRMVLNVLTSRDGGTYTCLVREGQDAVHGSSFTLNVQGELWIVYSV